MTVGPSLKNAAPASAGFTLVELMVVIIMIGLVSLLSAPKMRDALARANVRSARSNSIALYQRARASAIESGRVTTLRFTGNVALVTAGPRLTGSGTLDTIGNPQNMFQLYQVSVTAGGPLTIDPRGLGTSAATTIYLRRAGFTDSFVVTGFGRLVK